MRGIGSRMAAKRGGSIAGELQFATPKHEPVSCRFCGHEWPRHPALEVECPRCQSRIGFYCGHKRPSGHKVRFGAALIHVEREALAIERGFLEKKCPNSPQQRDGKRSRKEMPIKLSVETLGKRDVFAFDPRDLV